ncbi:hypothetical protein [Streptomyces sp. NBC_01614]|uniref:hypothetical protein n=1 Tax=Streptomyces sp. NBC_01614 TaxID=2975897 RepID=UPI0038695E10
METWDNEAAAGLERLINDCGSGRVQATVERVAGFYFISEEEVKQWLVSILLNSTHDAVMDASKDVATTEVEDWDNAAWSRWLRVVCIQAGYPMTANPPSGQGAFPGPVSTPQQQTQGTGYVWTPDPAPQPAPAGHTATTTVYQNQAQDEAQGGDESDDSALLGCALNPQLQALTFDALAAHLAQWGFTRERVQHSLARIAYNSKVNLQGLDWNQAWRAIAANEQALSLEAMVDACLAQRLHLYTALANISGTAHVQQIDVANYIITLARHRLNRTYTDPDTAYFDLQRTVVPQPPPNPTRKRQRSQPDDYAPWLLSAALSTDSLRAIAQQAEPAGAPTTEAGIEGAIRVLGGKLGLQGTAQEIRQQLHAMEHNGTLQNPDLYTPAPTRPPNAQQAQHALGTLTPVQQWLLSAALSTDNFREIAQQAKPAGAPTTETRIKQAIHRLGGKLGLQGTAQEIRQQLHAMEHNGTLQNPDLYTPAPTPTRRPARPARPEQPQPHAAVAAQRGPQHRQSPGDRPAGQTRQRINRSVRHRDRDLRPGGQVRSAGNCAGDPQAAARHGTQRHTAKPRPLHTGSHPPTERPASAQGPEQSHRGAVVAARRSPQR